MSADTFRALCAELLSGLDELVNPRYPFPGYTRCAMDRTRTLLAQPEPEDRSQISDGYHTFADLYEHRYSLMLALMRAMPDLCWFSQRHSDGEPPFGSADWFIVGADLPTGAITYHVPTTLLLLARQTGASELAVGRPWDGHTASDVIDRLRSWASTPQPEPEGPELTDAELQQMLFNNHRGAIEFLCDAEEEARLIIRNHVKFARTAIAADRARRPTPQPPADGEVAELVRYGVDWNGIPANPLIVPMEDGYWTPWHIATALLQRLASPSCLVITPSPEDAAAFGAAHIAPGRIERLPADMQLIEPAECTVLVPVAQPVEKDCGSWPDASNDS